MNKPRFLFLLALSGLLLTLFACSPAEDSRQATETPEPTAEQTPEPAPEPPSLLGEVTREQIEEAEPEWVAAEVESEIDAEAALALANVDPDTKIQVYLGTWCGDSRRELARFWRALDETGGMVSFEIEYLAVDRAANRPPELEQEVGLQYVPTFIVSRGDEELGRMVEVSPNGIERDLLGLLTGELSGVVSAREDLGGAGEPVEGDEGDSSL
ncbi:MAG: thioredoxin family protein [bacterium]|nr:thioredoxin family protein [bacterium]